MTGHAGVLPTWLIVVTSFSYVSLLFAIAYYGDRRAERGKTLVANPYIYALSIAVYCTAWTFYGSVGRAARSGIDYLTIYIGPTLMFALGWVILRKMIRISKVNHITSIADFISSRYGKSHLLGGLVTIIAVVGIMPYISLQLKAVASSFTVLMSYPTLAPAPATTGLSLLAALSGIATAQDPPVGPPPPGAPERQRKFVSAEEGGKTLEIAAGPGSVIGMISRPFNESML